MILILTDSAYTQRTHINLNMCTTKREQKKNPYYIDCLLRFYEINTYIGTNCALLKCEFENPTFAFIPLYKLIIINNQP